MIFSSHKDSIIISLPGRLFDYDKLEQITNKYSMISIKRNHRNVITIEGHKDKSISNKIRKIFTEYHSISINFLDNDISFINASDPVVSCIILLNSNDEFVNKLTIPSIIYNTPYTPIEIIVVYNGKKEIIDFDEDVLFIESELNNIPKAYNKAAKIARGEYLAFFHDDCFLIDEQWVEKAIHNLDDNIIAVGPEFHNFRDDEDYKMRAYTDKKNEWSKNPIGGYFKEVPMIIKRDTFFEIGQFPDHEIIGQEDIFLHQNILKSGKLNARVDIENYHFEGISTLCLFSTNDKLIQDLCNHFILSKDMVKSLMRAFTTIMMEKRDLCLSLYKNNLYDSDFSPVCDSIKNLGKSGNNTKKFMEGIVKAFAVVDEQKIFKVIEDYVSLDELIIKYINELK